MHATKIVLAVHHELAPWQRINVAAFLASGVVAVCDQVLGLPYADRTGQVYAAMFGEPVFVFAATGDQLDLVVDRARRRDVACAIFTRELFGTNNDNDNRAAVRAAERLDLVGAAFRADRKIADKIAKGLMRHE